MGAMTYANMCSTASTETDEPVRTANSHDLRVHKVDPRHRQKIGLTTCSDVVNAGEDPSPCL